MRAALHGLRTAEARLAWIDEVEAELTESSELQKRQTLHVASSNTGPVPRAVGRNRGVSLNSIGARRGGNGVEPVDILVNAAGVGASALFDRLRVPDVR
jgi:hypothetical protein